MDFEKVQKVNGLRSEILFSDKRHEHFRTINCLFLGGENGRNGDEIECTEKEGKHQRGNVDDGGVCPECC